MAKSEKMFVLGMDGMDPRLTKKYVEMGIMPNTKKFIEQGAQREDLVLLGGHPTVTPSMWTTLSRGCYSNVHGRQKAVLQILHIIWTLASAPPKQFGIALLKQEKKRWSLTGPAVHGRQHPIILIYLLLTALRPV